MIQHIDFLSFLSGCQGERSCSKNTNRKMYIQPANYVSASHLAFAAIMVIIGCVCCSWVLKGQMPQRFQTEINAANMPVKEN